MRAWIQGRPMPKNTPLRSAASSIVRTELRLSNVSGYTYLFAGDLFKDEEVVVENTRYIAPKSLTINLII